MRARRRPNGKTDHPAKHERGAITAGAYAPEARGGWVSTIREPFTGAWQRNVEVRFDSAITFSTVYACISLIASDVAKMRLRLVERLKFGDVWRETESASFSPVLRRPNRYQTRIQFYQQWMVSKLAHGNTYVLKERDSRGVVTAIYILDPSRVRVLVAPDGEVLYSLGADNLTGIPGEGIAAPSSEIIHDINCALHHPLVGISPLQACGLAAMQGLEIQQNSAKFFRNMSRPSGLLSAPGKIGDETARRLKDAWEANYGGGNIGRIAVLGDDLKFVSMAMPAADAQMLEQLRWTAEPVCSAFHVPPYKVGVGPTPTYANAEVLNQIYYTDCLQVHIESIELLLDEGLGLVGSIQGRTLGTEFDLDALLRMDSATKMKTAAEGVGAGILTPNEARRRFDLEPVEGGNSPYLQQQNYSIAALAKRDSLPDPFGKATESAPIDLAIDNADVDENQIDAKSAKTALMSMLRSINVDLKREDGEDLAAIAESFRRELLGV